MPAHGTKAQQLTFETNYAASDAEKWVFHDSADALTRFLRDRRIKMALEHIRQRVGYLPLDWKALVVCGGVGGEGTLLANSGFTDVTVSDFSASALRICEERDPRLQTRFMNAEGMEAPDNSYDLALVQDGLHHLPRPVLGFTEMLRVARRAVVVIEPHAGIVSRLFGTRWERHGATVNYVSSR
jgi:ubiquinone/menaquinone biosynthesis C-methylase UbiE